MILSFAQREQIRFKCILYQLYIKYIENSSELAINISYKCRNKIVNLCQDMDEWLDNKKYDNIESLFHFYEETKQQIIQLIKGDSLPRFRLRTEYQKIVDMLQKVKQKATINLSNDA